MSHMIKTKPCIRAAVAGGIFTFGLVGVLPAQAALLFDQDVTPDIIFGSGNANGGFTVDQANGIELGLRGKLRHNSSGSPENTFNSNGDGSYSFDAGVAPTQSFPTAVWSFEWSINTDYQSTGDIKLDDLVYELGLDTDPGPGASFGTLLGGLSNPFDPINDVNPATSSVQWDHAIGDNSTGNGGGTSISNGASDSSGYASLIANNNVAQNSWKPDWFIDGFDPNVDGRYDFYLEAFDGTTSLARTDISIIVGAGAASGTPVPLPGTLALFILGLAGAGFSSWRRI